MKTMLLGKTATGKRQTVVLLRWVLIIAFSYLLLLDASATAVQPRLVLLIALALTSNLVIGRMPDHWADRRALISASSCSTPRGSRWG